MHENKQESPPVTSIDRDVIATTHLMRSCMHNPWALERREAHGITGEGGCVVDLLREPVVSKVVFGAYLDHVALDVHRGVLCELTRHRLPRALAGVVVRCPVVREHLAERERHVPNALVFRFGEAIAFALTGWPAVDALSHAAPCTSRASLPTRDLRVSRAVGRGSSSTSRS